MHPVDLIYFWAKQAPARTAVVQPDMVVTFKALADAIESAARRVEGLGLDPKDPVAVCIDSPVKMLAVCLALLHRGFSVAVIGRGHLLYLVSAGIKNVIYDSEGLVLSGGRNIRFEDSWLRGQNTADNGVPKRGSQPRGRGKEGTLIFFTSGTTGRPKKIVHSHATLLDRLYVSGLTGEAAFSTVLFMPGLGGSYGFNRGCAVLFKGGTLCFGSLAETAAAFTSTFGVELIVASPAQAQGLTEFVEKRPGYDLSSLKEIRIAGSAMSNDLVGRIQSTLCRNVVVEYASTEAGIIALAPHEAIRGVPGAAGILAPWAELEIIDKAGNVLSAGEEGIIRCRTAAFSDSFALNNSTGSTDPGQAWWYPGDIGRLSEGGLLIVSGRIDDLINQGGIKASAVALDEVVSSIGGIRDAAVCAVASDKGLDELWVAVVPERTTDIATLQRSIEAAGSLPMPIARLFAVEDIPRTDLGKIRRNDLRDKLLRLHAAQPAPQP
jgi:acyl-coenzyme A synthetase/AMP-(fatty) acid ligase